MIRAAVITGVNEVSMVKRVAPLPMPDSALIRPAFVGLCGTDLELLRGTAEYMADGRTSYPHTFGHEWSGYVEADSSGIYPHGTPVVGRTMLPCDHCARCRSGDAALCQYMAEVGLYDCPGAAAELIRVPTSSLVPIPTGVPERDAVLAEPSVTALKALRDTGCASSDHVAVIGTGTLGLLTVQLAEGLASTVTAIGVEEEGLALARTLGARETYHAEEAPQKRYSVVVEASGAASGFETALAAASSGGRIAAVGVPEDPSRICVSDLVLRGLTVHGVVHGYRHYDDVLSLMANGALRATNLVRAVYDLPKAAEALQHLDSPRPGPPKILLSI